MKKTAKTPSEPPQHLQHLQHSPAPKWDAEVHDLLDSLHGKPVHPSTVAPDPGLAKTKTSAVFLVDWSGSMQPFRSRVVRAFNRVLTDQRSLGPISTVTWLFNTVRRLVETDWLDDRTYCPEGGTSLYDSLIDTIDDTKKQKPVGQVVVVIISDGEDNMSQRYSIDDCYERVTERLAAGWRFIFIGANQNAVQIAETLGIPADCALTFGHSVSGLIAAFRAVSDTLLAWRKTGYLAFAEEHRKGQQHLLTEDNGV